SPYALLVIVDMYESMTVESVTEASADTTPVIRTSSVRPNIDLNNKRPSVRASTSPFASTSKIDTSSGLYDCA
ncbi:hypothetical protein N9R68_03935, partial [Porticoccaceae bacterium]|nr:hypothetical protein [Porticoccaceae bacterium]